MIEKHNQCQVAYFLKTLTFEIMDFWILKIAFMRRASMACRACMMYSFFATCAAHQINPLAWLTDVLTRIPKHPVNRIEQLLPHFWANNL